MNFLPMASYESLLRQSSCNSQKAKYKSAKRSCTPFPRTKSTSSTAEHKASSPSLPATLAKSNPKPENKSTPKSPNGQKKARHRPPPGSSSCLVPSTTNTLHLWIAHARYRVFSVFESGAESELSPLVMTSNCDMSRVRGTNVHGLHSLPVDLLDRVLIVSTNPYMDDDIQQIIQIRCVVTFAAIIGAN